MDLSGTILGGRYQVVARLGGGGMAVVYKAADSLLNRTVAVKVLRPPYVEDDDFVRRFRLEAQSAAALSHPNIVNIYDVGRDDKNYYIVMEYVDGETLEAKISREGRLLPPVAVQIAVQTAGALQHAHQNGIIHRDIKPHNIMITKGERVKVTDFGIAKAANAGITIINTGSIMGSAHYLSPEQARGGYTDEKSDVYSLGVVLYEMLTGRVPFQGDSPISVAIKHIQDGMVPPRDIFPDIPMRLEAVVLRAMEKDQSRRYPSASSMLMDLLTGLRTVTGGERSQFTGPTPAPVPTPVPAPVSVSPPGQPPPPASPPGLVRSASGGSAGPADGKPGKGSGYVLPLVVAAIVLVLGGLGGYFLINGPSVKVPAVLGESSGVAQGNLRAAGLNPQIVASTPRSGVKKGDVVSQDPPGGELVKKGRTVNLVISSGTVMDAVPALTQQSLGVARVNLVGIGLKVGGITYRSSISVPDGYVISQSPKAGVKVAQGSKVNLVVSNGMPPTSFTLPSLIGQNLGAAEAMLKDMGLYAGGITYKNDPTTPLGTVLGQNPAPNAQVPSGSSVDLILSTGGGAPGVANNGFVEVNVPQNAPINSAVRVELDDNQGTSVIYNGNHNPGDSFTQNFVWYGTSGQVRVYVNGALSQTSPLTSSQ